jgi:hypothetical protein
VSNFFIDNCTIYNTSSLTFYLKNISDNKFIENNKSHMEFLIDSYSGATVKTYNSEANTNNVTICIFPNYLNVTSNVRVDYKSEGSNTFSYRANSTILDNVTDYVTLYVTSETQLVVLHVTDNFGTRLTGVVIDVLQYDVGTNTFNVSSIVTTDWNGDAFAYMNLYDTWYNFLLTYQGRLVLDTGITKVTSTTVNFVVSLTSDAYDAAVSPLGIYSTLVFDNTTKYFYYTWDALSETINESCLLVEQHTLNSITEINYSCSTSQSGSILLGIGPNSSLSGTYVAKGLVVISGETSILRSLSVNFEYVWKKFGGDGLLVTFMIVVALVMIGLWNISVAAILGTLGLTVSSLLGFIHIPGYLLVLLAVITIIFIMRMNKE